jgi:hypothetical protein
MDRLLARHAGEPIMLGPGRCYPTVPRFFLNDLIAASLVLKPSRCPLVLSSRPKRGTHISRQCDDPGQPPRRLPAVGLKPCARRDKTPVGMKLCLQKNLLVCWAERQLCPGSSNVNFLGDFKVIVDLDTKITERCFQSSNLHRGQVAGSTIDQRRLVRRRECIANLLGSRPMPPTHSHTRRAYCRVLKGRS